MSSEQPIVSICCLVYNHEPFLRDCFDGFLMQKTNFPIEILVHDDASTDHSADIIREYTEKYPDLFKPIYQKENQYSKGKGFVGMTLNFERAKGKYIAMCEGDDYWTDPLKLQKQVDFLEQNNDFDLCSTNAKYITKDEHRNGTLMREESGTRVFTKESFYYSNHLITCTVMFRAETVKYNYPTQFFVYGDWLLYLVVLSYQNKKAIDFDMCTAAYRVHQGGVFSGCTEFENEKRRINQVFKLQELFNYPKDDHFYYIINQYYENAFVLTDTMHKKLFFSLWYWTKTKRNFPYRSFYKLVVKSK